MCKHQIQSLSIQNVTTETKMPKIGMLFNILFVLSNLCQHLKLSQGAKPVSTTRASPGGVMIYLLSNFVSAQGFHKH